MPYITISYVDVNGHTYAYKIDVSTFQKYIQTPKLTLEIKQGDCDDQAILVYAMIKYYMKYVVGTEYTLYLAEITFNNNEGHLAVFLPVQGGELYIIDPAGHYLTSTFLGTITSQPAYQELQSYSNWWSSEGGIKRIVLYEVNIVDGSYTIVEQGNISQIASFLSTS